MDDGDVGWTQALSGSKVALLATYRRNGEPVVTPVSIAVSTGGVYFVTSASSGKARRLTSRPDVTMAPSTVRGTQTGPATHGKAHRLSDDERRWVRRLLLPGGPLFWSHLLYRIRGHHMHVYEVRFAQQSQRPLEDAARKARIARIHRAVQLTARTSALLFSGAQAASALGPRAERASRVLYVAFMAAHAVHFSLVARYAVVNGGRDLFPGGRSLNDVGGWPTVTGIYSAVSGLAITGWLTGAPRASDRLVAQSIGHAATAVIAAMFVSVYLGQLRQSRWYAVPATLVVGAVAANMVARRVRRQRHQT